MTNFNLDNIVPASLLADILSVSKRTIQLWENSGKISPAGYSNMLKESTYDLNNLQYFQQIKEMLDSRYSELESITANKKYTSIELFAGAGGLAIGLEKAGFEAIALNEIDKNACQTLRKNRPTWNIIEDDITNIDFTRFAGIDFLSGGFPCQAFSYAGKSLGFEDTRGTLFFEFARAVKETQPKVFLAENVRGLLTHDNGNTIEVIKTVIKEIGYTLIEPRVLKAIFYRVPQKRERLILIGIRNDLAKFAKFEWPSPYHKIMTIKDALKKGELYNSDVPKSHYQKYPERKKEILDLVPEGGFWKDLPKEIQKEYMMGSFYLGGGKTGMARRLAWDLPSLTLTCAPAQKQTERCHPSETRPLSVREYARIQTFPDSWEFTGSLTSQYKQIGNAVPCNLAYAVGKSLISVLNSIYGKKPTEKISHNKSSFSVQQQLF
ncbi:MAG: DNA (cytosine-5-)-methyltransferase [Nitrospirae bacterium]|nr:DNA (cytosine-5-)-methyltransferase [Nitrospirota bacterium]